MTQLTITIGDAAAEKARQLAQHRQVTVDLLVQELIEKVDVQGQAAGRTACEVLNESFRLVSTPMGGKPWTHRDELYDR